MIYTLTEIYTAVRTAIDEIALNDAEFEGEEDNTEMKTIIRSKIEESADYVTANCDNSLLLGDEASVIDVSWESGGETPSLTVLVDNETPSEDIASLDDNVLTIDLRAAGLDMLRLLRADVRDGQGGRRWPYPVTDPVPESEPEYAEIADEYVGADWDRPAVTVKESGGKLELWKLKSIGDEATVSVCTRSSIYTDNTVTPAVDKIAVDSHLYKAMVYEAAGLTAQTYGEERAGELLALARREMGLTDVQQ